MNKEEIKNLVNEMTPNVLLYVSCLMESYEKLEQENIELKQQLLEKKCSDKDVKYKEKNKLQQKIDKAVVDLKRIQDTFGYVLSDVIHYLEKGDSK